MNLVSQYVIKVGAYVLFALLLEGVLPEGSSKKIVKLMLSLMFVYVLAGPLLSFLQQGLTLEELTTVDAEWGLERYQNEDYQSQAMEMVEQGRLSVLKQNLPRELSQEYEIVEVEMEEENTILVQLARSREVGGFNDKSLELGYIGVSNEEEERIKNSLCEYWGIAPENLEMKLR